MDRNKVICLPFFEGHLFCQAICFLEKVAQCIKFIHFDAIGQSQNFLKILDNAVDDDMQVDPSDATQLSEHWPYKAGVFPN